MFNFSALNGPSGPILDTTPKIQNGWQPCVGTQSADYVVKGEYISLRLTKDNEIYTLWFKGEAFVRSSNKKVIRDATHRILASLKGLANRPAATVVRGVSID